MSVRNMKSMKSMKSMKKQSTGNTTAAAAARRLKKTAFQTVSSAVPSAVCTHFSSNISADLSSKSDSGFSSKVFSPPLYASAPPTPPQIITPEKVCNPQADKEFLQLIARKFPKMRKWIIANPQADPELLEYISQAGGPGVCEAFEVLFESLEDGRQRK